jgi:hypothetical protein
MMPMASLVLAKVMKERQAASRAAHHFKHS